MATASERAIREADGNYIDALATAEAYTKADAEEDAAVEGLLAHLRRVFADCPRELGQLDGWERYWRRLDARADMVVLSGSAGMALSADRIRKRLQALGKSAGEAVA